MRRLSIFPAVILVVAACGDGSGEAPDVTSAVTTEPVVETTTPMSTSATTSTSAALSEVVSAESLPLPEPSDAPLPYPDLAALESVTQAEIDARLGDLVRQLATANPAVAWPSEWILVVGRVTGVLLFKTFFEDEGMCIHGFDGARHTMTCGGTDGSWTGALGPVWSEPLLSPEAAIAVGELGSFVLLVTYSWQPWVAIETPAGNGAQVTVGMMAAFPIPLDETSQTVRIFGPNDWPESVDWKVTLNGTTAPAVPADLVFADATADITTWEFVGPPRYRGDCLIPVQDGVLPCTGEVWRRVTFTNPDVSISIPASWQVGLDATGIRLSSAVEPMVSSDKVCSLSGIPLMSAKADDVVLHLRSLEDITDLPPRPEDFAYNNIQKYVRGPTCAAERHLIEYDLAFVDQGQGFLLIRIASDEGPPLVADDIMNSLTVGR